MADYLDRIKQEAQRARDAVNVQVLATRSSIALQREQTIKQATKQKQEAIKKIKKEAIIEERKADLPGYGAGYRAKVQRETDRMIKDIKEQRIDKASIDKQLLQAELKLKESESKSYTDIDKWEAKSIAEGEGWLADKVELDNGDLVSSGYYNSLPKALQSELKKHGVDEFNRLLNNPTELSKILPPPPSSEAQSFITVGGGTITGEYIGPPTSLGGTWGYNPESLARQKSGLNYIKFTITEPGKPPRIATEIETTEATNKMAAKLTGSDKTRYDAEIAKINQSIYEKPLTSPGGAPLVLSQGGVEAVYSGPPSSLGGTWGKTPETLAWQSSGYDWVDINVINPDGSRRKATAKETESFISDAMSKLSETDRDKFNQTVLQIDKLKDIDKEAPWTMSTRQELEQIEKQVSEESIKLDTGEYIPKIDWDLLTPPEKSEVKKIGIEAIYTKIHGDQMILTKVYDQLDQKYQKTIKDKGFEAYVNEFETDQSKSIETQKANVKDEIAKTETEIIKIEKEQESFKSLSFFEKAKQILNTKISGEDLGREVLSFGGVATTAFDKNKIKLDYLNDKKQFLKEGAEMGMSEDEYTKRVLDSQPTIKELGMQFVPFEYLREGRWDELQGWEKIVWPAVDVLMLVPIAGWAVKGVGAVAKAASTGAKIAAAGGKQALQFAAKEGVKAVETASAKTMQRKAIKETVEQNLKTASKGEREVIEKALQVATKDVVIAEKELSQIAKQSKNLQLLLKGAEKIPEGTKGAKAYEATIKAQRVTARAGKVAYPLGNIGASGAIIGATIPNWNDLSPTQRIVALSLAGLTLGIPGKALNTVENVFSPSKIPLKAIKPRKVSTKMRKGELWQEKGGAGTVRLIVDEEVGGEAARKTMAELMREMQSGADIARVPYGDKIVRMRGTGLQRTVGETTITATPMGEIFQKGTGASGVKTNLEQYLEDIHKKGIKYDVAETVSIPGVTIVGKEGGEYVAPTLYSQFAHKAAFGATGKIDAGILIGTPGISKLPKNVADKSIKAMEKEATKTFDGSKYLNQEVEGFKQYSVFMEAENVITNGSQQVRVKGLRSKLADKLHMNKGEYFTRDKDGKIELFQMYIEGGRTTPYTLKEIYQLKGNALTNSLEDVFVGLSNKLDDLVHRKPSPKEINVTTKEEYMNNVFKRIDNEIELGRVTKEQALELKSDLIDKFRRESRPRKTREAIRKDITRVATVSRRGEITRDRVKEPAVIREPRRPIEKDRVISRDNILARVRTPDRFREEAVPRDRIKPREDITPRDRITPREEITPRDRIPPREEITPRDRIPRLRIPPRKDIPPRLKIPPRTKLPPIIKIPGKITFEDLTKEQKSAAIVWKQGFYFWLIYPPYGKTNVIGSFKPFPGVKVHKGAKSAYKSVAKIKGAELPDKVSFDLGIMDLEFEKDKQGKDVIVRYRPDVKERTTAPPPVGMPKKKIKRTTTSRASTVNW